MGRNTAYDASRFVRRTSNSSLGSSQAEKDHARCEDQLRESIVKRDELLMQLSEARHAGKGEYEHRLEREVKRLREDALKEVSVSESRVCPWCFS